MGHGHCDPRYDILVHHDGPRAVPADAGRPCKPGFLGSGSKLAGNGFGDSIVGTDGYVVLPYTLRNCLSWNFGICLSVDAGNHSSKIQQRVGNWIVGVVLRRRLHTGVFPGAAGAEVMGFPYNSIRNDMPERVCFRANRLLQIHRNGL